MRRPRDPRPPLDAAASLRDYRGRDAEPTAVRLIEHPDPSGHRWETALVLLIDAGRETADSLDLSV